MLKVFQSDSILHKSLAWVAVCVLGVTLSSGAIAGVSLLAIRTALSPSAGSPASPAAPAATGTTKNPADKADTNDKPSRGNARGAMP